MSNLQMVLSLLPSLSSAELATVRTALASLEPSTAATVTSDPDVRLSLDVICSMLQSRGVEFTTPNMLCKVRAYRAFVRKVPAVFEYLKYNLKTEASVLAALRVGVNLLYDDLTKTMNLQASSRTMLAHFHRIPAIMNQAFPSYAACGMLELVVMSGGKR